MSQDDSVIDVSSGEESFAAETTKVTAKFEPVRPGGQKLDETVDLDSSSTEGEDSVDDEDSDGASSSVDANESTRVEDEDDESKYTTTSETPARRPPPANPVLPDLSTFQTPGVTMTPDKTLLSSSDKSFLSSTLATHEETVSNSNGAKTLNNTTAKSFLVREPLTEREKTAERLNLLPDEVEDEFCKSMGEDDMKNSVWNFSKLSSTIASAEEVNNEASDSNMNTSKRAQDESSLALHNPPESPNKKPKTDDPVISLPETCTVIDAGHGSKIYLVGTAHFSKESQEDVVRTIRAVQPDVLMLELCKGRMNVLHMDEETVMREAENMSTENMVATIKQYGAVQGSMYLLMLSMSAKLTRELGMAPGGEFRAAYKEAKTVPGCLIQLGDRPIQVTMKRGLGSLSVWQKIKMAFSVIFSNDKITKEDVEKCKQRDMLESMMEELAGKFRHVASVGLFII